MTGRPCKHATAEAPVCGACVTNRARVASWAATHPGKVMSRYVRWLKRSKRARRRTYRAYYYRHPAKIKAYAAARNAALRGARIGELVDPVRVWLIAKGRCWLCGWFIPYPGTRGIDPAEEHTLDHVVPCSQGGEHSYRNTKAAHCGCNSRRGAPDPAEHGAAEVAP